MENPSLGSVISTGLGDSNADGSNERINIAPGVVPDKKAGLSIGAQRMELETWKQGVMALKGLLESLDRPVTSVADGKAEQTNGSSNLDHETK